MMATAITRSIRRISFMSMATMLMDCLRNDATQATDIDCAGMAKAGAVTAALGAIFSHCKLVPIRLGATGCVVTTLVAMAGSFTGLFAHGGRLYYLPSPVCQGRHLISTSGQTLLV